MASTSEQANHTEQVLPSACIEHASGSRSTNERLSEVIEVIEVIEVKAMEHPVDWVKLWEEEKRLDIRNFLQLRKAGFKARELELVQFIKKRIGLDAELVHQAFEMIKAREEEIYKEGAAKAARAKAEEPAKRDAGAASKEITEDGSKGSATVT